MNAILIASLLAFLAALGSVVLRALPAHDRASRELVALGQRGDALAATLRDVRPVSWERLAELEGLVRDQGRLVDARIALLLDPSEPPPPIDHAALLAATSLPALQPGAPLRATWDEVAARSTLASAALARALVVLDAGGVFDLEELVDLGQSQVDGLPSLTQHGLELVAVAELPVAMSVLEALTPRPGSPVVSVVSASLRRIQPGLWPTDPIGLGTPPVRLWVRLSAVGRDAREAP